MSEALAPNGGMSLTPENFRELLKRPLLALPAEVRPAALIAWSVHQHLFPSALPIAGAVSVWINEFGLLPDEANTILRKLTCPGVMGEFRFAGELMTFLATAAKNVIERRKNDEYLASLRNGEIQNYGPWPGARDIGRMPDDVNLHGDGS